MKHIALFGALAAVVCAMGAFAVAPAIALELPEFATLTGFTGQAGLTTLETVAKKAITCKKATLEGRASSKENGTFTLVEKECTSSGVNCNSRGSESGVISLSGEWRLATEEGAMMLLSLTEAEISCTLTSVKLKGSVLGLLYEVDAEAKEHELEFAESEGVQELGEYENDKEEAKQTHLLTSTNGGAFEEAALKAERLVLNLTTATQVARAPTFAVEDPLGNRPMRVGRIQWRIVNVTRNEARPVEVRYTESPIRAGNRPFLINEANRLGCLNGAGIRPGRANACAVELEYLLTETGALAILTVKDRPGFVVHNVVRGL